ncbi:MULTISPECIES: biotin--[acetyl-CoA-carboxylase] ligase [Mycolicibacterium]|uniref:biotin--[biotin carboxyl-carrier protein] ligase n=1 Tax=Mycolicibacterium neoaurum TaxID=1795 RepID=A0AAV2WQV0_MYCNE|nr:biotin--[acetyl-CoA-carboxylase] ligase [Mycolicibacterium neoaurum]QVI26989.1 biotin--[acetyl-CoA-carboxylase] ligase [Mycolicibacterium neoaurum]TLH58657.1 biotin--[acetyl-CoA-carboxylase] ligase [Mycolicibacterium neoaurum]CDQ46178.1 birA, biotin-(acetyl-CoA-carboxylase) ligase [Mycolicibacterium neoaurum]SDC80407.1 BirA family transcriptional regulator, biotin operon repressor / biotin-[acetyl-CoA-carboxylase] ligase [Mycolicibacterium neoaurum]
MTADRIALDAAALRAGLAAPWQRLDVVDETGSTNADLIARAAAEPIAGAVLLAEHQAAGRGRGGRVWEAVPRGLVIVSVGISTAGVHEQQWGLLPLLAGVAVVDTLAAIGVTAGLKWPNDVQVGGAKIAGILAEVASPQPVVVLGIGLNVAVSPDELGQANATSVQILGGPTDRTEIARILLGQLGSRILGWQAGGGAALLADYRTRSATLGRSVRALLPGGREIAGTATGVDEQGRLCIDTGAGTEVVAAADIVHLRPLSGEVFE